MPTIRDVAAATALDPSTVSRALNGSRRVARSTRERVLASAKALGYVPNPAARELGRRNGEEHRRRTGAIAFVLPRQSVENWEPDDHYKSHMFAAVHRTVSRRQLLLVVHGYTADDVVGCRPVLEGKVDGVIGRIGEADIAAGIARQIPLVLFHSPYRPMTPIPVVNPDVLSGMCQVVEHLHGLGHRRVAYFRAATSPARAAELHAWQSFTQAVELYGVSARPGSERPWVVSPETHEHVVSAYARDVLLPAIKRREITAVVCANDVYAWTIQRCLREHGIHTPTDVSITGFDNRTVTLYGERSTVTTIEYPFAEMIEQAMQLLEHMIAGEQTVRGQVLLQPDLVIRESTGPAPPSTR